ncbi:flagellar hook-basal body complex protein FliE [Acetoanaerobium pronyense]|uniref:Flagellar hook-basal body complex protein FliE n=1 Tax=Acetoanaerobium pronyense TaxID=1482736 RepID=A0ABS4KF60_9FIRM|nr:flagellar hook-basal body complex protein FliE [Acetoanaerobium pronyense]MBP2026393.1 flagellar hook-basal body complex protein FliE [Acetoanaerobium pronyense]
MDIRVGGISYRDMGFSTDKSIEKPEIPFSDFLKESVYKVSDSQMNVQKLNEMLVSGELENLHDLTIASEISSVNFQALVEVKNKVLEAYKEIMRIQV